MALPTMVPLVMIELRKSLTIVMKSYVWLFTQMVNEMDIAADWRVIQMKNERYLVKDACETHPILNFRGDYYFLSNFHPSYVTYEGDIYPTVEHAFQAAKIAQKKSRQFFTTLPTPDLAKYHGRRVELRPDWEQIKDKVMYDILKDKFSRDPNKANLLATGNRILIEGNNWHDNYWGVCSCERCQQKYNHGRNQLGKTLMQIRDELRNE